MLLKKPAASGAALLAFWTTASGCMNWDGSVKASEDRVFSAPHVAEQFLEVHSRNGSITVTADPAREDVRILASITATDDTLEEAEARLAETEVLLETTQPGRLVVRADFPGEARGNDGCSFVIETPGVSAAILDTSNAWIVAQGLSGDLVADTSNGSVTVTDHDGPVEIDTSNGNVQVQRVAGNVEVDTSNGSVELVDVGGHVEVDTSNGYVKLQPSDGATGPFEVETSNGSVSITLPVTVTGTISVRTSNGSIVVDGPREPASVTGSRNSRTIVLGNGPASSVSTSNGSVTIRLDGVGG